MPPYWPRLSRIANNPRDNMQVELTDDVAKAPTLILSARA